MALRSHRRIVFGLAVAIYLGGATVALVTGIPSAFSVSILLVAGAAWAYGPAAGLAAMVGCLGAEFVALSLLHKGTNAFGVAPVFIIIPVTVTQTVVLLALSALHRAELRQLAGEVELREKNAALEVALAEVKELRGMLPICAWCKSIRDVDGMWDQLEAYLSKHAHVTLTHGICPTCVAAAEAKLKAG